MDALELAQATMAKVYQNLSWAIAYNVVAIPIAAGALLPHYDFAMTPSLSGMQNYTSLKEKLLFRYLEFVSIEDLKSLELAPGLVLAKLSILQLYIQ